MNSDLTIPLLTRLQHQPPRLPRCTVRLRPRRHRLALLKRHAARSRGLGARVAADERWRGALQHAAFPGQGEARHPPLHGGRAVAVRDVRLEAGAEASSTASRFPSRSPKGQQLAQLQNTELKARGPFVRVSRSTARSGIEISDLFPHIGRHRGRPLHHPLDADRADQPRPGARLHEHRLDHQGPAEHGLVAALRPRRGDGGPARLRRADVRRASTGQQPISARQWSSGFLPSKFQGIQFQSQGRRRPLRRQSRRRLPEHAAAGGRGNQAAQRPAAPRSGSTRRSHTRIAQYEMAFKMQTSRAGADRLERGAAGTCSTCTASSSRATVSFASNCLLARRLAERGVRMIQLYHRAWDHHGDIDEGMKAAREGRGPGRPPR